MIKGLNIKGLNKEERYTLVGLTRMEEKAMKLNEKAFVKAFNTFTNEVKPATVAELEMVMAMTMDIVMEKVEEVNVKLAKELESAINTSQVDGVYYIEGFNDEISIMASIANGEISVTIEDTRKANMYGDDTVVIEKSYKTVKGAVKFIEKYL